jgi:hypothetical protein
MLCVGCCNLYSKVFIIKLTSKEEAKKDIRSNEHVDIVFWVVTLRALACRYQHFGETKSPCSGIK